ncbi:hypothetical protein KKH27_13140 [bacterium]|nr:hypothetical protein [bacterium]MBU1983254.1 hypothetical protein [bacterium]
MRQANAAHCRLFVINGDVLKYDYDSLGTPEAVLADYRAEFATKSNPLTLWPQGPGPAVFVVPGGHDEQYFLDPEIAAAVDTTKGGRYTFEGTNDLGVQLYQAFYLEDMRIRVQTIPDIGRPFPFSPYGDYLLTIGSGSRRQCALLALYRTDRWAFREAQMDWTDSVLTEFRKVSPTLPLIVVAHDWTWFFPDTLDNGSIDGARNAVRGGSPESDRARKQRLYYLLLKHRVDLAVASDRHAYWAGTDGGLLRVNSAAAIHTDPFGKPAAFDNVWLEYAQNDTGLFLTTHAIEPPIGCGLRPEAAAFGTAFEKNRSAGSIWRKINREEEHGD